MSPSPSLKQRSLSNLTVRVGSEVQFACTVSNLDKEHQVAWLHEDKGTLAVHPTVISHNERLSVSHDNRATFFLTLTDVQPQDAGKYICQINTGPFRAISGNLNVVAPPDISDEDSSSDTLAREGMRVLLSCQATGNPRPAISWVREDKKPIRVCRPHNTEEEENNEQTHCKEVETFYGQHLELQQVSRFDSGAYLCLANNGVPPTVSKRIRLYVDFSPMMWISHQLVGVAVGGSAELECLTAAHPPSLNFWSRDGRSNIKPRPGKYEVSQVRGHPSLYNIVMRLRVHNVSEEDFGTYSCLAENPLGETSGEINVYNNAPPHPPSTTSLEFGDVAHIVPSLHTSDSESDSSSTGDTNIVLLDEEDEERRRRIQQRLEHQRRLQQRRRLEQQQRQREANDASINNFQLVLIISSILMLTML